MKRRLVTLVLMAVLVLAGILSSGMNTSVTAKEPNIVEFDTMAGLPQAFTRDQNPIRGISGGGLPWSVSSAHGELKASGKLEVTVQGLVFAAGPNTGSNTVPSFRAIVSCLRGDGSVDNIVTDPFPATTGPAAAGGGNAAVETMLALPQPCIAPIIFITSPGGAWFAVTGQ